jgi:AraC-like DNA-binding protein
VTTPLAFSDEDIALHHLDSRHIPAIHASLLCDEVESLSLDSRPIIIACGRKRADLLLQHERITPIEIFKALEATISIIGRDNFGFEYGRVIDSISSGRTTRVAFSAPTLKEAINRVVHYTKDIPCVVTANADINDDRFRVRINPPWNRKILPLSLHRFFTEAHMSLVFKKMVDFLGRQPSDVVIRFAHEEPIGENGFRDLNISVIYNAGENSISLPKAVGDESNVQYVKCLSDQAISLCEERLKEHTELQDLTRAEQVREIVLSWEALQSPTLYQVAQQLNISPRTLTRSLKCEGNSFQHIIDQQKCTLAKKLLAKTNQSIDSIANQLGYNDPSNFSRAFKKWSNKSPKEFRRGQCPLLF